MSDNPHESKVLKLWTNYVKALPNLNSARLSGDIKTEMFKAAASSNGDKAAIKAVIPAYLAARGRDPTTGAKIKGAVTAKPPKKAKKEKESPKSDEAAAPTEEPKKKKKKIEAQEGAVDPAKDALIAAGAKTALKGNDEAGVPKGNIDLRALKRPTLKGMAIDLEVKYKKKWTDDELRAKVARKMIGMDSSAVAAIAAADPAKVEGLTDCVGLMLDLTKAICITCPAQQDCRKLFEEHRKNGWKVFDGLKAGDTAAIGSNNGAQTAVKVSGPKLVAAPTTKAVTKINVQPFGKVSKLPTIKVDSIAVDNGEHKEFLIALKKTSPTDLAKFNDLVLAHYDTEEASKLCAWFVKYCVAVGAIVLV